MCPPVYPGGLLHSALGQSLLRLHHLKSNHEETREPKSKGLQQINWLLCSEAGQRRQRKLMNQMGRAVVPESELLSLNSRSGKGGDDWDN